LSFSSGTFSINTAGQPVVTGTTISSTAFNALTADLATGLTTCVLKDGTQTTTAIVPFAAGINVTSTTSSFYKTDTQATTVTGYASDPSITLAITKIGNRVFLTIPTFTGTSDSTGKALADVLAAAYRPTAAHEFYITATDNGGTPAGGVCRITTGGAVSFYPTPAAGNWTGSGTATVQQSSTNYQ